MRFVENTASISALADSIKKMFNRQIGKDNISANIFGNGLSQDTDGSGKINVDDSTIEINSNSLRVKDKGITNAKLSDVATLTVKGRKSAGTGSLEDLTSTDLLTVLGIDKKQLAKALVNFNGTSAANVNATYSRTGTTVTVTLNNHGYVAGHVVYADFTSGAATDGLFVITGVTQNTFDFAHGSSGTTSGNVTLNRRAINFSYNIHSVTYNVAGDYVINISNGILADSNYVADTSSDNSNTSGVVVYENKTTTRNQVCLRISCRGNDASFNLVDPAIVNALFFGN